MRALSWCVSLLLLGLAGCTKEAPPPPPGPPFQLNLDMKQLMTAVIDPNADVVWGSVGTVVSAEGEDKFLPKTDEEWTVVRNSAATVLESGNLLMLNGRARNQDDWMKKVLELMRTANEVLQAVEAKDAEAVFTAGSDMYLACNACHAQYIFDETAEKKDEAAK